MQNECKENLVYFEWGIHWDRSIGLSKRDCLCGSRTAVQFFAGICRAAVCAGTGADQPDAGNGQLPADTSIGWGKNLKKHLAVAMQSTNGGKGNAHRVICNFWHSDAAGVLGDKFAAVRSLADVCGSGIAVPFGRTGKIVAFLCRNR